MDHIEKLLRRAPPKHRAQILKILACLGDENCRSKLRPEKLSGNSALFRVHAGRYRVIFSMHGSGIDVIDVRLRNEATYRNI